MKTVRAKFVCNSIIPNEFGGDSTIYLSAVVGDNGEDKSFSDATPYGQLVLGISKGTPALEAFKQGQCYYLDFTVVPK